MAKSINDFRLKLISKIRLAESEYSIARYVDAAVRTLIRRNVHGHLIVRFLDRSIADLQADDVESGGRLEEGKSVTGMKLLRLARMNITDRVN